MDDPSAILRAQLDEDERAAQAAGGEAWRYERMPDPSGTAHSLELGERVIVDIGFADDDFMRPEEAAHAARHDPARTLAEVAAMRKVLDCWPDPSGAWTAEQADAARAMKRRILELLAEPYATP